MPPPPQPNYFGGNHPSHPVALYTFGKLLLLRVYAENFTSIGLTLKGYGLGMQGDHRFFNVKKVGSRTNSQAQK